MTCPLTEAIADYDRAAVPNDAIAAARESILDTLGCMVAGGRYRSTDRLRDGAGDWQGAGTRALFGGTAAHSVEMDDFHDEGTIHPGVVVVPAALDAALDADADGGTFLDGVIVGYETAANVGLAGDGTYYDRGFHTTSAAGVFAATAATGVVAGLTADELDDAFGIAGSNAGGLLEYKSEGAWTKRLQVGMAAETGVRAANLASAGFTGPSTILDGRYGFLGAYPTASNPDALSSPWSFESVAESSYKPYACCRYAHAAIDASVDALERLDADPESISSVSVETHRQAYDSTAVPRDRKLRPEGTVDAQFSLPFVVGVAALHGEVLPTHLSGEALRDATVLDIAERVTVEATDEFTDPYPATNGARVAVTADGTTEVAQTDHPSGDPANPLSTADLREKFRGLVGPSVADPDALADRVLTIGSESSVEFLAPLVPAAETEAEN